MKTRYGITALAIGALAACAAPVDKPEETGFLSSYGSLKQVDDDYLFYTSGKSASYTKFILDPVVLLFEQTEGDEKFTQEQLDDLKEYFDTKVQEQLTRDNGYEIVDEPGPGVARLRCALTDVEKSIGALNLLIYTKVTGAGLGGAAAEGELVDSVTGEQIAAAMRWGTGSRVLHAGLTDTGDAKIAISRWAKDIRKELDVAHGRD